MNSAVVHSIATFFVVSACLTGCASGPRPIAAPAPLPAPPSKENCLDVCRAEAPVATFPRDDKKKTEQLYGLLRKLGVKERKTEDQVVLTAYELTCTVSPQEVKGDVEMVPTCEFFDEPSEIRSRRRHSSSGVAMEELRFVLHAYPLDQGDSGASSRFVQCAKSKYGTDCYLAIKLNYEGP